MEIVRGSGVHSHSRLTDAIRERVEAYALGLLTKRQLRAFQKHIEGGCATCAEALQTAEDDVANVALWLRPVLPPPRLRRRFLNRIGRYRTPSCSEGAARALLTGSAAPDESLACASLASSLSFPRYRSESGRYAVGWLSYCASPAAPTGSNCVARSMRDTHYLSRFRFVSAPWRTAATLCSRGAIFYHL